MHWIKILEIGLIASLLTSFTDWYFFGVLFHEKYNTIPGVWKKYTDKKDEMRSIMISTGFHSISCFVFAFTCDYFHLAGLTPLLFFAFLVWLTTSLPLLLSYGVYIRMDRHIVVSHSLGWLVRLLVSGLCVAWLGA